MPDLLVSIDGATVPLKDCHWVQWAPCGCLGAVVYADFGDDGELLDTEAKAWRDMYPDPNDMEQAMQRGCRLELVTGERVTELLDTRWKRCPHKGGASDE